MAIKRGMFYGVLCAVPALEFLQPILDVSARAILRVCTEPAFIMWLIIMKFFMPNSKLIYSRYKWYRRVEKALQQFSCSCRKVPHASVLTEYFVFINCVHFNSTVSQITMCENSIIKLWYFCRSNNWIRSAFNLSGYSLYLSLISTVIFSHLALFD